MKVKYFVLTMMLISVTNTFAQIGIRAGVNTANELHSFNREELSAFYHNNKLTGYQIGLVYQANPQKSGLGFEVGALLSQKGGIFEFDKGNLSGSIVKGYHEINYLEVPVNLRLKLGFGGIVGVFGTGGIYGAYALKGKTVFESDLGELVHADNFDSFIDKIDYGYSFGCGIELLRKIQVAASWNRGLEKKAADKNLLDKIEDESGIPSPNLTAKKSMNTFTVSLTYQF